MKVLLVAAEHRIRVEIEEWLRRAGHSFRSTGAGDRATGDDEFQADVIVAWLPQLLEPALARCRELQQLPAARHARVLTLGPWHKPEEVRALLEAGADDYLHWPVDAATFELRLVVLEADRSRHPLSENQRRLQERVEQTQKMEGLATLAGGIAHDFNNLLAAILGNTELALLDAAPQSPTFYCLEQIEKAARRAAELTRQMLTYSGRAPAAETREINLTELVQEMTELLRISISKRCTIEYEFGEGLPPIEGDASQLRQVVMNLLINASEAMGARGGLLRVKTTLREVGPDGLDWGSATGRVTPGRYVCLEVSDDGHGMDAQTMQRIFDPFFTTKKPGRGLGLAAVLGIIRGHQGAIQVESKPGEGTTIRVLVPSVEEGVGVRVAGAKVGEDWHGEGTLLLVDDEDTVREAARRMLEKAGYTVLAANSGESALEIFADFGAEISAVILNPGTPGMGGVELLRGLRRLRPEVKIIAWSGLESEDVRLRWAEEGASAFIEKPSHSRELAQALRRALQPAAGPA
jgi:two-component system, cell cycle sensor histidine kinase and response regulator CckA